MINRKCTLPALNTKCGIITFSLYAYQKHAIRIVIIVDHLNDSCLALFLN